MAFKPEDRCKVCQFIQAPGGQKLLKRIYKSRAFDARGESLRVIAKEHEGQFSYLSLITHSKKHQALTTKQLAGRRIQSLSREIENEKIRMHYDHNQLRELVINRGYEDIQEGKVKLTATSIMTAAKQSSDIEEKNKDRQFEVLKMISAFAAGELVREEIDGPITSQQRITAETPVDHNPGTD